MNPVKKQFTTFDDRTNEAITTTIFQSGRITHVRKPRLDYEKQIQSLRHQQNQWNKKVS